MKTLHIALNIIYVYIIYKCIICILSAEVCTEIRHVHCSCVNEQLYLKDHIQGDFECHHECSQESPGVYCRVASTRHW